MTVPGTPDRSRPSVLDRRTVLRTAAAAGLETLFSAAALSRDDSGRSAASSAVLTYLAGLARPDGGYAWWEDQSQTHLTPTFAAVGCFRLLKHEPPNKAKLAEYIREHHPFRIKKLERDLRVFEWQQIQSLLWLDENVSAFRDQVRRWTKPTTYPKQYEQHGYPVFRSELTAFVCRRLLGLPHDDLTPQFIDYLLSRRRDNGSFNNTPASDGSDGHAMNTWWGLEALHALDREVQGPEKTIAWLRDCQLPNGGFTYQPRASIGGIDDVAYTWAAVRALKHLGAAPADRQACVRYLGSLANADGGFGDRPGWASNPMATYYALDALNVLAAAPATRQAAPKRALRFPTISKCSRCKWKRTDRAVRPRRWTWPALCASTFGREERQAAMDRAGASVGRPAERAGDFLRRQRRIRHLGPSARHGHV